jgi:hypothetical protein
VVAVLDEEAILRFKVSSPDESTRPWRQQRGSRAGSTVAHILGARRFRPRRDRTGVEKQPEGMLEIGGGLRAVGPSLSRRLLVVGRPRIPISPWRSSAISCAYAAIALGIGLCVIGA